MTATARNPLIAYLGYTSIRANGGAPVRLRAKLRLQGMGVADDEARRRSVLTPGLAQERVQLEVGPVPEGDYWVNSPDHDDWFGYLVAFDEAADVLIHADEGVRFAGFSPPLNLTTTTYRKTLVNAGSHSFELRNFRADDDAGDYADPGMIQLAVARTLAPGESARIVWDPAGQRWLVNDGLVSAEILTIDNEPATSDGVQLTYPEV